MKYKTVIEIVCDAANEEDAYHTAGEYLRSNDEVGTVMVCKTHTVKKERIKKITFTGLIVFGLICMFLSGYVSYNMKADRKAISCVAKNFG